VASLHGIYRDVAMWKPADNLAYLVRPLLGGIVGAVGFLIYLVLAQASVLPGVDGEVKIRTSVLALMISFALGYREELFRTLLQRMVDLLATAGGADTEPPSAPGELSCKVEDDGVHLFWTKASDNVAVVGYNIYRDNRFLAAIRVPPEPKAKLPAPAGKPRGNVDPPPAQPPADAEPSPVAEEKQSFVDRGVCPGPHWYSLTAVDGARNESEAVGPNAVRIPGEVPQ
jgi:hypothetical protein